MINELNQLGDQFRDALDLARSLPRFKCGHIIGISPKECFANLIGKKNESQYLLATQDQNLRQEFRSLCLPLLYFSVDFQLDIEEPDPNLVKQIKKVKSLTSTSQATCVLTSFCGLPQSRLAPAQIPTHFFFCSGEDLLY